MGLLNRLFGREDAAKTDARRIYTKLMAQSRSPAFFGESRFADSYDGRIDVDASVKKRIQPMISLFYDRVKKYAEALNQEDVKPALKVVFSETLSVGGTAPQFNDESAPFIDTISTYLLAFDKNLGAASLGDIALAEFSFPSLGD